MASMAWEVFARARARRSASIKRMVAAASAGAAWPAGPLDIGPEPPAPTAESAEAFLDAVERWVLEGDSEPSVAWFSWPWPAGVLSFCASVRQILREATEEVGGEVDGTPTAAHIDARLDALTGLLSARLDQVLAREQAAVRALAWQLEGAHSLASPLNVITLQAGLMRMRLDLGATEGLAESLDELTRAGDRLIDERRRLSERTEAWCHRLRRAMKDRGALEDQ